MKIKHHGKRSVKLRAAVPKVLQPSKPYREVVSDRSRQRQKIPHRIAHSGC